MPPKKPRPKQIKKAPPKRKTSSKKTTAKRKKARELSDDDIEIVKKKVKAAVKEPVTAKAQTGRAVRLKKQSSLLAFGDLTLLEGKPKFVPFGQAVGANTATSRGCKSAEVVLGPLVGWPEPQPGTDAVVIWPEAITDVRKHIDDSKHHWKSGHVINADFGGYGGSDENMTCLTSSANTQQTAFDNNVKKARMYLHKFYTALRDKGMKQSSYFASLKYGIKVSIELSDETWGDAYPWNCVSKTMTLDAEILNEPAEDDVRAALGADAGQMLIGEVLGYIENVSTYIAAANQRHLIQNQ